MTYRIGILFVTVLLSTGVAAHGQEVEKRQERVTVDDLNLDTIAGQKTARKRVDAAARAACADDKSIGSGLARAASSRRCIEEARTSGEAQVQGIQSRRQWAERQRQRAAEQAAYRRPVVRRTVVHRAARYRSCTWPKRYAYKKRVCVWRIRRR